MPKFHFHVVDGQPIINGDPAEMRDAHEARVEAIRLSGALLQDHANKFWEHPEWRMWVTDEAGETVCSLRFSTESASQSA